MDNFVNQRLLIPRFTISPRKPISFLHLHLKQCLIHFLACFIRVARHVSFPMGFIGILYEEKIPVQEETLVPPF
jgi:hypothetical protein